jgi:DNA (cytosine-5)-methyltransferase 1
MENVPQVHGAKNKEHFDKWIAFLESKGYSNYWTDLNAKNYGIPQNRNRCFMVSVLGGYTYEFPQPVPLELTLGDMLEKEVDEKYYLSEKAIQGRRNTNFNQYKLESRIIDEKGVHPTILARYEGAPTLVDETKSELKTKNSTDNQIANTLTCNVENMGACVPGEINVVGNYSPSGHEASRIVHPEGVAPTIKENHGTVTATVEPNLRIRKLTPKECWRLMGFSGEDVENAAKVCSNSQLYKQAGNSIVVNVLMAIFKELFVPKKTRSQWLDELLKGV